MEKYEGGGGWRGLSNEKFSTIDEANEAYENFMLSPEEHQKIVEEYNEQREAELAAEEERRRWLIHTRNWLDGKYEKAQLQRDERSHDQFVRDEGYDPRIFDEIL